MWANQILKLANNVNFQVHQPAVTIAADNLNYNNCCNKVAAVVVDSANTDCFRNCDRTVIIATDDDANLDSCPCDMDRTVVDSSPNFSSRRDSP